MKKVVVSLLAATLVVAAPTGWAAPIEFEFSGTADFGSRAGSTYMGAFTFDDATLTGVGDELIPLDSFSMNWTDSATFDENFDLADLLLAEAVFFDGAFLGVAGGSVAAPVVDFELIAGFFDISEAAFFYGINGTGDLNYARPSAVPAPATALMLLGGLVLLRAQRRRPGTRAIR